MTTQQDSVDVERHLSHETVCGFRVAAYRETHPEHGAKYGHRYSEHWSTPNTRNPDVKVERLFTEDQLRAALSLPITQRDEQDHIRDVTKVVDAPPHHTSISLARMIAEVRGGNVQMWSGAALDHLRNYEALLTAIRRLSIEQGDQDGGEG